MEKYIDFIIINKYNIIAGLIVLMLICLVYCWLTESDTKYDTEYFQNIIEAANGSTQETINISDLVDHNIYFKYEDSELSVPVPKYLAVSSITNCDNFKKEGVECIFNMVILQPIKNEFALWNLKKSWREDKYNIASKVNPELLSNKLVMNNTGYIQNKLNPMCVDGGTYDSSHFELDQNNVGKYRIKFTKTVAKQEKTEVLEQYIGKCPLSKTCDQGSDKYTRLCLVEDPTLALYFDIEIGPDDTVETAEEESIMEDRLVEVVGDRSIASNVAQYDVSVSDSEQEGIQSISGVSEEVLGGIEEFMPV
jgi:hypothetical protein